MLGRPHILLFGDSLTQRGFENGGWVGRLAHAYSRRADVANRGLSGLVSLNGLQELVIHKYIHMRFQQVLSFVILLSFYEQNLLALRICLFHVNGVLK